MARGSAAAGVLVLALLTLGCASKAPSASTEDAKTGEEVIAARCTACHERSRIDSASYDRAGWEQVVDRMIAKGARLTEQERSILVEYLAGR